VNSDIISVARGHYPADILIRNARIINVFTGEIETGNIAVHNGMIAGIGDYQDGLRTVDLQYRYVAPGLIDGHVHLESSMLDVSEYARAIVPHGTLGIITDLHEIANVAGIKGIKYVLQEARKLPLDLFLMAPSCVPATHLETGGATITPHDIKGLLRLKECIGLGEVMNYPGVLSASDDVLNKIKAAKGKIIDGHAPGLTGKNLNAYIASGIMSDHESVTLEEARLKLQRGMKIMIREGSSEKNLATLLPLINENTYPHCFFVVDDRSCSDLLHDGDIDAIIRKAIQLGLNPIRAVQMATINTATYFRLKGLGAVAPGYRANIIVLEDLADFKVRMVFYNGTLVAESGKPLFQSDEKAPDSLINSINIKPVKKQHIQIKTREDVEPVIEVVPGQIITRKRMEKIKKVNGFLQPDIDRDLLKAVVIERHKATGNIGIGFVKGFGLKKGAMGSSVAHDSHNIVVVGTNDGDIIKVIEQIQHDKGGLAVAVDGRVIASLALPVCGLLSNEPLSTVVHQMIEIEEAVKKLGCTLPSPFATLSFLALPVIPDLRLTDLGLVDVNEFKLIRSS